MSEQCCKTTPAELAEIRRRCWAGDCNRTARLELFGWRYCIPHYWSHVVRGTEHCWNLLNKFRHTEIVRR